jgi:pilus assembly protein CpaB
MGTLTLSLRSIADNAAELERAVAAGDVKLPAGTNPSEERRLLLAVANRPTDNNTTYTTGGDVSRFQRRTVPARTPAAGDPASAMASFARALSGTAGGPGGAAVPAGPVVRVTRGNTVTVVPVGAR